jgi:flavin-dependent dehydrogenase
MDESADPSNNFDVAVIGGGPAGATASALLAQNGRRVILIEKDQHPRFHIGESLLPKNLQILERLGVAQKVLDIGVLKPGAEFVSPFLEERQEYSFGDAIDPNPSHAYQVRRAEFDEILIRNAVDKGATVLENHTVSNSERLEDGWLLSLENSDRSKIISAKYLIDASGRDGFLAQKLNLRRRNKDHNSAALFAHFENVNLDLWQAPGNIAVFWFEHGWIWMIPLTEGVTSVGAVCMPDYFKTRKTDLNKFYEHTLGLCPDAKALLKDAKKISTVQGAGNYAYSAKRAYGDGYLLIGDAHTFIDPVFSSGVLLAMSSAERAAKVVDVILDHPNQAASLLSTYQRNLDRAIRRISWFVYRFNSPTMQRLFMEPRNILGVKNAIISLLSGDFYRGPSLDFRLGVFKLMYAINESRHRKEDQKILDRIQELPTISLPEDDFSTTAQTTK